MEIVILIQINNYLTMMEQRSYKGFMIDAVILVDREEIIIRWFEAVQ